MSKIMLFIVGVVLFFGFIFFSYLVHEDVFTSVDFDTTVRLQDNISRRFDEPFSWFSEIGSFEVTVVVLLLFLFANRKVLFGLVTFFLFGLFHIIEIFGKNQVEHLPPPQFMLRTQDLADFPQFHVRAEYSYPSGHSGRTIFLSILFILFIIRTKKIPMSIKVFLVISIVIFDGIMLVSRIYLGEHWLTDVVGGAILGAAFACIAYMLSVGFSFLRIK
jgi:membrane-associated phospholipid phosphatase